VRLTSADTPRVKQENKEKGDLIKLYIEQVLENLCGTMTANIEGGETNYSRSSSGCGSWRGIVD
jgi:hypothetical protein